jgi:gliding motility-associated-like protein
LSIGEVEAVIQGGTAPYTYSLGGTPQASPSFNGLPAGTYALTVTDGGSCSASMSVEVIEQITDMSTAIAVDDVSCFGFADGVITATTGGSAPGWHYQWLGPNGNTLQTTPSATIDQLVAGPGTYTVIITEGQVGGGCADTLTATILEPSSLSWNSTPQDTTICLTGNAALFASTQGGSAPVSMMWSSGFTGGGPHVASPASGQWAYTVTATDANGCTITSAPAAITVRPPISFMPLQPDTECVGLPVTFDATGVAGGDGAYTYDWGNGASQGPSFTTAPPVSGNVCVTVRDGCETPAVTSCAWLEVLQTPPFTLSADTALGCVPLSVRFALRDTTGAATVEWEFGDGAMLVGDSLATHTYAGAGNFDVALRITWPNGCITDSTVNDMVRTLSIPIAQATWSPRPATINDPVVRFTDLSLPNVVSWQWDFGAFGTSEDPDPVIEFPNEAGGIYPLRLVVANALGCTDTLNAWVDVQDEFMVWVPNAFTPNDEGQNEEFFISGNDLSQEGFEFMVFDRWGGLVFSTSELGFRWDGTKDGQPLPQGVYPYRLKVESHSSPKKRVINGHVNLLR